MKRTSNGESKDLNDVTIVDAVGNIVPCKQYDRIVSLVPSITETLFDFGVGTRVMGVTRYCVHPPEAQRPPRTIVGGSKSPKIQLIKKLNPDLVIINKEEQKLRHAEELRAFTTVFVTYPRTVADAITMLEQLARLLMIAHDDRVKSIISETKRVFQNIKQVTSSMDQSEKPRVFCPIWKNPWMTINADTFIHDMITTAGGINIFQDKAQRYPIISTEEIKKRRPDLIILPDEPYRFTKDDDNELKSMFRTNDELPPRIQFIEGSYLSWYGSRTRIGLQVLHELITKHVRSPFNRQGHY